MNTATALQKEQRKAIKTGHGEVDDKMGGGVPLGSLTLVEGDSDSGKSVLLQHYTHGALQDGFGVAYYTNENTVRSLLRQMESLGLDVIDDFLLGDLDILSMSAPEEGASAVAMCDTLLRHVGRLPQPKQVVIIDSITNVVNHANEAFAIDFFSQCKRLCDRGKTIFVVVHSYAFTEQMLIRVRSLCDAHFHLKVSQVGERMVKTLEVAKVRGAERTTGNIITFDVEPGMGMKPIPISMAKA